MFLTLPFLIVLASMTVKVLAITLGPQFITCPLHEHYKFVDNETLDQYEVYGGEVLVYMIDIKIKGDFKRNTVYAYINSTAIDFPSHAKEVRYDAYTGYRKQNTSHKWEFIWKYKGHAGAAAQIVRNGLHGYYEVVDEDCEVTTCTIDERWLFKNTSFSQETTELPSNWHRVSAEVTAAVHKIGLSCLKKQICTSLKNFLQHTFIDETKDYPLVTLNMTVNRSVDRSLIRIRENIRAPNDTIGIPQIQRNITAMVNKQIVATGGSFTNLSTIERMGDAIVIIRPHEYHIFGTYIIRNAFIHYDHYSVESKMGSGKGKMSVTIKDVVIQGSRLSSAKNCKVISQHISVTKIGKLKYKFQSSNWLRSTIATLGSSNSDLWSGEVKNVISGYLPRVLKNAFDYGDNIFGPCMHSTSKLPGYTISTIGTNYQLTEMSAGLPDYKVNVSHNHVA